MKLWIFLPFSVMAQVAPESDFQVELTKDGTGCVITDYKGKGGVLIIPDTIQGFLVKEIGEQAFATGRGVLGPVNYTFGDRTIYSKGIDLVEIKIPNTVEKIGDFAFIAQEFKSIKLPDGLKEIGKYAFYNCNSLESIELPNSLEKMGNFVFYHCGSLTNVKLSSSLKYISNYAFSACKSLQDIELPVSIKSIGEGAFKADSRYDDTYSSLKSIKLSSCLKTIGDEAFYDCTELESIEIPESVESIGISAFENTEKLSQLNLPNEKINIHGRAFRNSGIKELTIKNNFSFIKDHIYIKYSDMWYRKEEYYGAFSNCNNLETLIFDETVKLVDYSDIISSESLKNIIFKSPDTVVSAKSFVKNCPNLTLASQAEIKKRVR